MRRPELLDFLARNGGVASRAQALMRVPGHVIDDAVTAGAVVAVFRGVYCIPGRETERAVRRHAALLAVPGSALSHTDALAVVGLADDASVPDGPVHLTVSTGTRRPGRQAGLVVHRRADFQPLILTNGCAIVEPHQAVVDSWALLPDGLRRDVVISAVREGLLSTTKLRQRLARNTRDAATLRNLLELLDDGCQSELEIFGLAAVFDHPSLPRSVAQRRVQLRSRAVFLDRAYDDELVGVELDGAAYHFGRRERERDMRRDAELAALGWLILRFSYARMVADTDGVRREIAAVIAARRNQLGGAMGS